MPNTFINKRAFGNCIKKYFIPKAVAIAYIKIPIPWPIEAIIADNKPLVLLIYMITSILGPGEAAPMKQANPIEIQS